ncbi:type II toxin-antitoxin system RelE/ParE family toxin [Akkermansiaceae bacterium]|nr:type II toxin-antitoxin system RelE/ParE family toxin [Akkermansiaceae bacterium]
MKPGYLLLAPAAAELEESAKFYNGCAEGLGDEFLDAFESAMDLIMGYPEAWGMLDQDFRRFLLRRFPFGIIYRVQDGRVIVTSVFHLSRKPESWRKDA